MRRANCRVAGLVIWRIGWTTGGTMRARLTFAMGRYTERPGSAVIQEAEAVKMAIRTARNWRDDGDMKLLAEKLMGTATWRSLGLCDGCVDTMCED